MEETGEGSGQSYAPTCQAYDGTSGEGCWIREETRYQTLPTSAAPATGTNDSPWVFTSHHE